MRVSVGCIRVRFLVCKEDDSRYEDEDGNKNEEEGPGFVCVNFVVENLVVYMLEHQY